MSAADASPEGIVFDGRSGEGPESWQWTHLRRSPDAERVLLDDPEIPRSVAFALLQEDTIPRATEAGAGTLLILRGVNLVPGADPEDMVSLRLWITPRRIVSTELRRLVQIDEMIEAFREGRGPKTPGAFVLALVEALRAAVEPVVDAAEDTLSDLETEVAGPGFSPASATRASLADVRRDVIQLHRYLAPQSAALDALLRLAPAWLPDRDQLREEAEAYRRISADLEALRQRGQLLADELRLIAAERMNQLMLRLGVIATVFLPVTFLAGLLGVNLAGIPFADRPWAFGAFCGVLVAVGLVSYWLGRNLMR